MKLYPKWSALNEINDILNIKMKKVQLSQQSKGHSLFLNKLMCHNHCYGREISAKIIKIWFLGR